MGQIKNIKLHIVTDIKHVPLHLCTIELPAASSTVRITITDNVLQIFKMAKVENTDVELEEPTAEETTMSDETTTAAATSTEEKMSDETSTTDAAATDVLQEMTLVKRKRKSSKPDLMDTGAKRPSFPPAADTAGGEGGSREFRKIPVPPHRYTPLKE